MILVYFLFFVSLSPTLCLKRRMLESVNRGYDFPLKEFVIPRLPNVPTDPREGIELWFSSKPEIHVLVYGMYSGSNPEGMDSLIRPKPAGLGGFKKKMINWLHWTSTSRTTPIGAHVSISEPLSRRHTAEIACHKKCFILLGAFIFHTWLWRLVILGSRTPSCVRLILVDRSRS